MRSLVVGYGSIGRRHERLLGELGCETAIASRSASDHVRRFATIESALRNWAPEYVVVATPTAQHFAVVRDLAASGFGGRVLVEKPIFDKVQEWPRAAFSHVAVAYQLRCHPLVMALTRLLSGQRLCEAELQVGQWLPEWRASRDYRTTYSAIAAQGGGALRDLSHELDLALYLFGPWKKLTALGGHLSDLEIDTDDAYTLLLETSKCPSVSIRLNYLDRPRQRGLKVNTSTATFALDLVHGVLTQDGAVIESTATDIDHPYREQHRAMIGGRTETLCGFAEGLAVVHLIAAAEEANRTSRWIIKSAP
ncbi:MAG: Gfo/Idh/MocA family oxidoreductase [Alphaproteobacteria bacterium]|nr:Gfo/Idh/MocA family oxidoreductase [Alphaproteobacteria bacterium]